MARMNCDRVRTEVNGHRYGWERASQLPLLHAAGRVGDWFVRIKETGERLPVLLRGNCTFITLGDTWWDYLDRWATGDNEFAATLRKGRAVLAQSHTDPDTGREYRDDYIGIFAVRNLDMTPIGLSLEINPQRLANVKRGRTTSLMASSSRPGF